MSALQVNLVLADEINPDVYGLDSRPGGMTFEEATMAFWKVVYETPAAENPILDENGERCRINNNGPIFFLFFSTGGHAERRCEVPAGKPILVPVNVVVVTFAEFNAKDEEELHAAAEADESSNPGLYLSVDGTEMREIDKYRVHSRAFDIVIPESPIVEPPGPTRGVSDGYWMILEPLALGQHTINFKASLTDPTTNILFYSDDVTYHLTVVEAEESAPIQLAGESTTGKFKVLLEWTSDDIGSENIFSVKIMDTNGVQLEDATYDMMIFKGDKHLDETHRSDQAAVEQKYIFDEASTYSIRIENINGSGESEGIDIPIQVTPEYPLGLPLLAVSLIGLIVLGARSGRNFFRVP